MSHITILAFGQSAHFCGGRTFQLEIELPCTVEDIRKSISARFPMMLSNYMIAVNLNYADDNLVIQDANVEIAIIPPVSGG